MNDEALEKWLRSTIEDMCSWYDETPHIEEKTAIATTIARLGQTLATLTASDQLGAISDAIKDVGTTIENNARY
jgi:hypothetical protein